jgi:preprotein translocase subunit YajC
MSRTYHATGTGSFTRAFEVRRDRSKLRDFNEDPNNLTKQEVAPMFGATREHREGRISFEEAMELIRPGDKIRTPDGILHKVTAANKAELVGRLGATVTRYADGKNARGQQNRGRTEVYRGNLNKNAKIDPKTGRAKPADVKVERSTKAPKDGVPRLSANFLFGVGAGTPAGQTGQLGFRTRTLGPQSTYKTSPNSRKTEIKQGQKESKGNTKLRARQARGGVLPKATPTKNSKAARTARAKAAGLRKMIKTGRATGNGPRKGGRSGRGRSR